MLSGQEFMDKAVSPSVASLTNIVWLSPSRTSAVRCGIR